MLVRGLDEVDVTLDGLDQFQLPLLCETIADSAGITSLNATLNQKHERGCRGHPAKSQRRCRSTGLQPGMTHPESCTKFIRYMTHHRGCSTWASARSPSSHLTHCSTLYATGISPNRTLEAANSTCMLVVIALLSTGRVSGLSHITWRLASGYRD